ncbi:MAG: nucleotide disphospho-sugar-binding domain-containing protein [Aestuariivita sp.]|uniref:glycosyltransferase n=1 Tax=Aestuariivita sp. TaxID=1872407 RepID=UPI003BAFF817
MGKHVLCVSELGAGAGHLAPMMKIARHLRALDPTVQITFAVYDPFFAQATFGEDGFPFLACPIPMAADGGVSNTGSFAEILSYCGFLHEDRLTFSLQIWDSLFDLVKPDLILADYSPTACLAARGRIPVASVGSGYTLPPANIHEYPALRIGYASPRFQDRMCDVINAELKARHQAVLDCLPHVLATEIRGVFAIPQSDPYGRLRADPLLGSYDGNIPPMPPREDGGIFLYRGGSALDLAKIVEGAVSLGRPIEAYLGPFQSAERQFLLGFGVTVHDKVPDLLEVLEHSRVIVSGAGAGLTQAAMQAGRPQLCLPAHMESDLNATRVVDLNVGLKLGRISDSAIMRDGLKSILEDPSFTRNAQALAQEISQLPLPSDPVGVLAQAILKTI